MLALAAVVAGVAVLVPREDAAAPSVKAQAKHRPDQAVIGRTLPPYRTTLEGESSLEHRAAFRKTEERARAAQDGEANPRPADVPADSEFEAAFKKAAK